MTKPRDDDQYTPKEAQRRAEAALGAAFNTPPKPQSEMKLGKRKISDPDLREVAESLGQEAAGMEAAHIRAKKKAPLRRG